jgi:hypothetical protein
VIHFLWISANCGSRSACFEGSKTVGSSILEVRCRCTVSKLFVAIFGRALPSLKFVLRQCSEGWDLAIHTPGWNWRNFIKTSTYRRVHRLADKRDDDHLSHVPLHEVSALLGRREPRRPRSHYQTHYCKYMYKPSIVELPEPLKH